VFTVLCKPQLEMEKVGKKQLFIYYIKISKRYTFVHVRREKCYLCSHV